jgi:hypothetical protein
MLSPSFDSPSRGHRVRELVCAYRPLRDHEGRVVSVTTLALSNPKTAAATLGPLLGDEPVEVFAVACLSTKHRLLAWHLLSRGTRASTAEQWIKEGKQAAHWTRLSCHRFRANEVRLQLSVLAYNLGNLWRRLVLPRRIDSWSLTSLQQRLVKTGGRLVKHARYYWLLLAESHLTQRLFGAMLQRIWALPVPTG